MPLFFVTCCEETSLANATEILVHHSVVGNWRHNSNCGNSSISAAKLKHKVEACLPLATRIAKWSYREALRDNISN
jgi:hypothetical protein